MPEQDILFLGYPRVKGQSLQFIFSQTKGMQFSHLCLHVCSV